MPVQLTVHTNNSAKLVRQGLENLSREIPQIGRKRIYEAMKRAKGRLSVPKARPRSPIQWDGEKQRQAFFASDGFGRGIPTSRTGRSQKWEISATGNGYTLSNGTDYARHLYGYHDGTGQSRIFQAEYPLFRDIVEDEVENLPEDIEQNITFMARQRGF